MERRNPSITESLPEEPVPGADSGTPMIRSDAAQVARRPASGRRDSARLGASRGWRSTFMGL